MVLDEYFNENGELEYMTCREHFEPYWCEMILWVPRPSDIRPCRLCKSIVCQKITKKI